MIPDGRRPRPFHRRPSSIFHDWRTIAVLFFAVNFDADFTVVIAISTVSQKRLRSFFAPVEIWNISTERNNIRYFWRFIVIFLSLIWSDLIFLHSCNFKFKIIRIVTIATERIQKLIGVKLASDESKTTVSNDNNVRNNMKEMKILKFILFLKSLEQSVWRSGWKWELTVQNRRPSGPNGR